MSTFMGGSQPTYMSAGPSCDEEDVTFGQYPNQQSYEGLYDSYFPTLVTGDLLSGPPPNGVIAAAQLPPTLDTFYQPQFQYGPDQYGNVRCWQFPPAIPPCCQTLPQTNFAPVNPIVDHSPPRQPIFGYGPIIGGGVPPAAFELRHHVPSRESSVQSTTLSNSIWSQVDLHPSPSLSFTESTGGSPNCSFVEQDQDLAYWSGSQYFAYPHFAQAEADVWDTQPYAGPIAASIQQFSAPQSFQWSLPQSSAPALQRTSLPSDNFSVAALVGPLHITPRNPTLSISARSTPPSTTPPSTAGSNTDSIDENRPARRPARRVRAAPATFRVRKNNVNPKSKIPEAWELEVVVLKEKHTYEQIRNIIAAKYGVHKAISTIRGVKRNVVLPPHLRPRKAEWGPEHLTALRHGFPKYATFHPSGSIKSVAWVKLCKYIEQQTGFPFGPTATHRIYNERLHKEDPQKFPFVGVVGKKGGKGKGKGEVKARVVDGVDVGLDMGLDEDDHVGKMRRDHGGRKVLRRVGWRYGEDEGVGEQEEEDEEEDDEDEDEL